MEILPAVQRYVRRYLVVRGVASTTVEVRGCPVHFYEARGSGKGPAVLLVHGLGGSANGFSRVLRPLSERFSRVLAIDLPGNGFSELPASGPVALEEQLEVLASFARAQLPEGALVVGNSLGGAMSMMLTHKHPELVRALALVAPAGAAVAEERVAQLISDMNVRSTADARKLVRRLFNKAPIGAVLLAREVGRMYNAPAVQSLFNELKLQQAIEPAVLQSIKVPTLLLWGASEKLLPYEGIDYFRKHLPAQAVVEVVEGFGHVPQMEHPARLVGKLVEFADRSGL